ncbi:MAG: HlyC/CorC family transporter [Caldilineales bacterium]|nr:HlyC/CorC family transporter [Caldilineales bacterium]
MNVVFVFAVIALLIAFNALYVAAEFATASSRRSRLAQFADEGNRMAKMVLPIVEKPASLDNYIAACQLGITITSLLLGVYGQANLAIYLTPIVINLGGDPLTAQSISAIVVLLLLTALQVLLGELVPKNIGVRYPERLAMATIVPLRWSMVLFRPLIWLFNGSARVLLRLVGQKAVAEHAHMHHPDEILFLVQESRAGGLIAADEEQLVQRALQFHDISIRQVMTPRVRMLAAPIAQSPTDLFRLLANSPYSRMPLYDHSPDRIVGIIHLKDLFCLGEDAGPEHLRQLVKSPLFVPDVLPIDDVLREMQRLRQHMAIVVDEFGGAEGLVTLEDLVEELFGEIRDEFDREVIPLQKLDETHILARGDVAVADINRMLGLRLPDEEAVTLAGLILSLVGFVPSEGDEVQVGRCQLQVAAMQRNAILSVRIEAPASAVARLQEDAL